MRRAAAVALGAAVLVAPGLATARQRPPIVEVTSVGVATDRPALPHVEPVVAVHPADPNVIAVAAMAIEAPHDDKFHDSWRVVVFVSADGGATWTRRPVPAAPPGAAMADPSLAWHGDGLLYLTALVLHPDRNFRTWLWRSRDAGRSWSVEPVPAAVGESQDHPVLHVSGPARSPTIAVFETVSMAGIAVSLMVGGDTALRAGSRYRPNAENNNLGAGLRLEDGTLVFSYFSMSGAMPTSLWAVRSADGGRSWVRAPITDRHVPVGFPMLAEDRSGSNQGRLYAVWIADEASGDVMVGRSDDGGRSWSRAVTVQHDRTPVLRARPAVHVNRAGIVMVSWTDGRADPGRGAWCWDVYAAASVDGAETFLPEVRLTERVTCAQTRDNGAAGTRWRWGGDYAGIGSDSPGRFYVSWADTRTGVYQPQLARLVVRQPGR